MTTIDQLNARGQSYLPGLIGPGRLTSRLAVRPELLAPSGYLHADARKTDLQESKGRRMNAAPAAVHTLRKERY